MDPGIYHTVQNRQLLDQPGIMKTCFADPQMKAPGSRNQPGDLLDAQGSPQSAPGVVLGGSWGSSGTLLSAPWFVCDTFWGAWVSFLDDFRALRRCPSRK